MNRDHDFELDRPPGQLAPAVRCGAPGLEICLLNRLASGDDLPDADSCAVCGKSAEQLDRQVVSIGNHLSIDSYKSAPDSVQFDLVERRVLLDSRRADSPPHEIGAYAIGAQLGRGGMGAVYRATHKHLHKEVAIKLLPTSAIGNAGAIARFQREMAAVGKLDHPNVVRAMDAGVDGGHSFLIMEWVSGIDLADLVGGRQKLDAADACELVRQAAKGLQYAHSQGLIHRDVKPANLMLAENVDGEPIVKVMDLGLALLAEHESISQLTDQGQLMGTLEFMAPEQAIDTSHVDHRADIYALGATLFRLLTGEVPFAGDSYNTPVKRLQGLANYPAPSLASRCSELAPELVELVDQMLASDPDERPQSMQDVAESLRPLAVGHNLTALCRKGNTLTDHRVDAGRSELFSAGAMIVGDDTASKSQPTLFDRVNRERGSAGPVAGSGNQLPPRKLRRSLAFAGVPLFALLAGLIWLKTTDGGYVRINADPLVDLTVNVVKDGQSIESMQVHREGAAIWLRSGKYEIQLPAEANDELTIAGDQFTLRRGQVHVVTIARVSAAERADAVAPVEPPVAVPATTTHLVTHTGDQGEGSLRTNIRAAKAGDTIRFDPKLAGQSIVLTSGQITIDKDLNIDASDLAAPVTLDAAGLSRVLWCEANHGISLANLIITGGSAIDNHRGGGIYGTAHLTLTGVVVRGNSAPMNGGGIRFGGPGLLTMVNCTVTKNRAPIGGGMYVSDARFSMRNCTISGNTATRESAAILLTGGDCTIVNSTLAENQSPQGTALTIGKTANAVLRHVTIANNRPSTLAPAYAVSLNSGTRISLQNCVVAANGGGVHSYDIEAVSPDAEVTTIGANLIGGFRSEYGHALSADVITGKGQQPISPALAQLGDYGGPVQTMPPLAGSPLIDAGIPAEVPLTVDARGLYRPIDGNFDGTAAMDIGAVEFNPNKDADLPPMQNVERTPSADRANSIENRRLLKIEHLIVRNEGKSETLQRSECQIIPFVTCPTYASDSPSHEQAMDDWQVLQTSEDASEQNGFVLPAWMLDQRRVPLPSTGPKQKKIHMTCSEGNHWCSAFFDDNVAVLELYDDPTTPNQDETLEVGFLFVSRFYTASDKVVAFEFKTLSEMNEADGPLPDVSFKPREIYTPEVYNFFRTSKGIQCGNGRFTHYFKLEFVEQ